MEHNGVSHLLLTFSRNDCRSEDGESGPGGICRSGLSYDGAWGSPGGDRGGTTRIAQPLCARWLKPAFGTVFGLERRVDWPRLADTTFPEDDGKPKFAVHSSLRRGWFFGSERFREQLLRMLAKRPARIEKANGDHGAQFNDYAERRALALIRAALEHFGIDLATLRRAHKADWRKGLLAAMIQKETTMRLDWMTGQLHMGIVQIWIAQALVDRSKRSFRSLEAYLRVELPIAHLTARTTPRPFRIFHFPIDRTERVRYLSPKE